MSTGTLTSKGQLTIPKEVRDALQLKPGQKLEFRVEGGQVWMRPRNRDVRLLRGAIKPPTGLHVTVEEMNDAIADGYAGRGKGRV